MTAYRHMWRSSLVSTVVEPALFLAAMGLTLGVLVDRGTGLPGGVSYLAFLAPGLLAAVVVLPPARAPRRAPPAPQHHGRFPPPPRVPQKKKGKKSLRGVAGDA